MKVLGIDTTRKQAMFFLRNEDTETVLEMSDKIKHSEGVFLYLEKLLFENNLKVSDFDYLCGIVGPGSFTGIRVGMSVIKGFNKVIDKKIVPLNTFEVLGCEMKDGTALLFATVNSFYYANFKNSKIVDAGVIEKENVAKVLQDKVYILKEEQNLINLEYINVEVIDNLSSLYFKAFDKKLSGSENLEFVPYYLQLSQAERNLDEKN